MPGSPVTPRHKPLPLSSPVGRASQLKKASSSQTLGVSPRSTGGRSRDGERVDSSGGRRTLESDRKRTRDLRHCSSSSTLSRATSNSLFSSSSGAGTIVGLSKDTSANRTVGSGQHRQSQDSYQGQPGRTPLAAINNGSNAPARNSRIGQENKENSMPAKAKHPDIGPARAYLPNLTTTSTTAGGGSKLPTVGAHAQAPPVLPQLRKLQKQIQTLKAENDDLRAAKIEQVTTIDDLRDQLRVRDDEHARAADRLRAEAATLKEEKWNLLGRVAELEQLQVQREQEAAAAAAATTERVARGHDGGGGYAASIRSAAPPTPSDHRGSEAGRYSVTGYDTPGSLYSGDHGDGGQARGTYHSASSSVVTASARSFVRQRTSIAESELTAASLVEEELGILSDQLAAHHEQHGKERQAMAAQLVELEGDLDVTRRQRDRAERRSRDLEARLATQVALVRHHSLASAAPVPTPPAPAPPPIPDLPVLTYAKVGFVWFDTVRSAFKYWGLSEFISQPDETLFAGTDPDREGRRLRAVVLLKRAMDDDILDDVMYLQNQKYISAPSTPGAGFQQPQGLPPEIESPYFLFHTAAILKRTVPSSLTDFGWLDRISESDFEGIEGFASLVNILNRRHSQLYGTTADHYDALVPKIQENMSRRFPYLEKSLMDPGSSPKKWWHLALWMSKMVKKRQGRIAGIDEP
ncbi:hypothetical protein DHEL01_v210353 [Diaporthe helianthi]|uniref:Uncharacterized protein n=1 Tax=Diaporthe helianthi TaxID=158607 RepID=A0A2P5HLX8_DIAHE|nr:hypothetical protein DHEL01_v210353 [Diaporthe helianthi]